MKNLNAKHITFSLLVYGMLFFSGTTMFESLNSDITWKIIFSTVGFTIFLSLAAFYTIELYLMIFE